MDDIDRIIQEIVDDFFRKGHSKISTRTVAKKGGMSVRCVSKHIAMHNLNLSWEKRDRGIIILSKNMGRK
ncbi:MAG: hypothetical protein M1375_01450 [Candidatus Thermoplasmatota archaeon]|jgi:hypothetical protein|nr:hypothetical protein [Candidatus Thermoplasmatota archaeon]MCL5790622.1 hypothetical protein [Candidatus Thermoplasmatota archaeon]